jgi:formiminoglutamate deiminase
LGLHLWFDQALLPDGWARRVRVSIEAGRIATITRDTDPALTDERHAVALPGMCNVHSHAFQRGMAGLTERRGPAGDDFWTWRALMYRFLDRLDPDDLQAVSELAFLEMLEGGYTRVGEFHYLHNDLDGRPYADPAELAGRIVAAAQATGIGLTLLPVFYAHGDFGGAPASVGQRRFVQPVDSFAALLEASRRAAAALPDAIVGVAPHSLRAVTPEELQAVAALAPAGPIHIHAAEQLREVEACVAWSGARPVAWLLDNAAVDARWTLIHATHLDEAEIAGLARSGAVAGLCPTTEANLGDGIFPADRYLAARGRWAIGSDSNIVVDPARELELLEYAQRLSHRARNLLAPAEGASTGASLFRGALAGGAQALGLPTHGIAEGASADLVSLATDHPSLAGRSGDALLDGWIFASRAGAIDRVWRHGECVVEAGRHRDRERIVARYCRTLEKLLAA